MQNFPTKHGRLIITAVLTVFALAGNYLSFPIFYGVDLIFGSIFVMLAILIAGAVPGLVVAIISSSYTWILWGHPYAMLIFTAEGLVVAYLLRRGIRQLVMADALFWLVLGAPMVLFFYTQLIGMDITQASMVSLKQPINGVFNAVIASLLFMLMQARARKTSLGKINIRTLFFNAFVGLTVLAGVTPVLIGSYQAIRHIEEGIQSEMQYTVEALTDGLEQMVSSFPGWGDDSVSQALIINKNISYAFLDKTGKILHQKGNIDSIKLEGEIITRDNGMQIWLPYENTSIMRRWSKGQYFLKNDTTLLPEVASIIVEYPAADIVENVEKERFELFLMVALITLFSILASFLISHWVTRPITLLTDASNMLATHLRSGKSVVMPESSVKEFDVFSRTLSAMSRTIAHNFRELSDIRTNLEKRIQERTAELEQLSVVANRTTNGVVITDADGRIEWVNDGFTRITGYTLDEVMGRIPGEFLQGEATDRDVVKKISTVLKQKKPFTEDLVNYTKDGRPYWIHIECNPVFDEQGDLTGFMAIETDITEKKRSEDEVLNTVTLLNSVLNSATEISIIATDTNGLITIFNTGAEKMLGYASVEMVNLQTPAIFHLMSEVEERGGELSEKYGEKIEGFQVFVEVPKREGQETREWTYVRKDGSHITVQLSVTTIRSAEGNIVGYLGVAQDITERKRVEKMKSEFVSTVSHELRTPLTSISGSLGLINGGAFGELSAEMKSMIEIALNNSTRLTYLINDLLDMEKINEGKMEFVMQCQEILPIIRQAIDINAGYAKQYGVQFVLSDESQTAPVLIDKNRLLQVLSNFLSNAAKFSPKGDVVEVSSRCADGAVRVSVRDHGAGVPSEFKSRIFEKFSQADSSTTRSQGGTGLGLAITRGLVEHMAGRVGFDSVEGEGSTFWFELPIVY